MSNNHVESDLARQESNVEILPPENASYPIDKSELDSRFKDISFQDGKEIMTGKEVDSFKGAMENYSFSTNGIVTTMLVETDVFVEESKFFEDTWPLALNRIKELCEIE